MPLTTCFSSYEGGRDDVDAAVACIRKRFIRVHEKSRGDSKLAVHVTVATDGECVRDAFAEAVNGLLMRGLSEEGFGSGQRRRSSLPSLSFKKKKEDEKRRRERKRRRRKKREAAAAEEKEAEGEEGGECSNQ